MKKFTVSQWLLALGAFLAPLLGGYYHPEWPQPIRDGLVTALFSLEGAAMAHAVPGILIVLAVSIALVRREVIQLPRPQIMIAVMLLALCLMASVLISSYKALSLNLFLEWSAYMLAMLAVIALAGRREGLTLILGAVLAGCVLQGMAGLLELRTSPSGWRIFGYTQNPNVLASLLLPACLIPFALVLRTPERLYKLLYGLLALLGVAALVNTGSKAGLGALIAGLIALVLFTVLWSSKNRIRSLKPALLFSLVIVAWAGVLMVASSRSQGAAGRITQAGDTSAQSAGFRKLLWQTSVQLTKEMPAGRGLGAFAHESARPGLATKTTLAHNTYLQLMAEASPLALLSFVGLLALVAWEAFRGARKFPPGATVLKACLGAAVVAMSAHGLFESNLYYFGVGLTFFLLLGLLLQASADAAVPEFLNRGMRVGVAVVCSVAGMGLLYYGYVSLLSGQAQALILESQAQRAEPSIESALRLAPGDYRLWWQRGYVSRSPEDVLSSLESSFRTGPTVRAMMAASRIHMEQGEPVLARSKLMRALYLDPNNLELWQRLLQIDQMSTPAEAIETAKRIVAIERTSYFQVRSLPQIVPTETYQARHYLATQATEPSARVQWLLPAVEGYLQFAKTTVPQVKMFAAAGEQLPGADPTSVKETLQMAIEAAYMLEQAYRDLGLSKDASWAASAGRELEATASDLGD